MKSKKLRKNRSITLPSCCLVVVVMIALCPASAQAQEQSNTTDCETIRDEVVQLRGRALETGEGLEELALRAEEALSCYAGRLDHAWAVWLLIQRVYAFDALQRYSEAQGIVDDFFTSYAIDADSSSVARFYMWDLRFKYRQGEFGNALDAYQKGLPYAHKLSEDFHKLYLLRNYLKTRLSL